METTQSTNDAPLHVPLEGALEPLDIPVPYVGSIRLDHQVFGKNH